MRVFKILGIAVLVILALVTLVGWTYFAWFARTPAWKNELDITTVRLMEGPVSKVRGKVRAIDCVPAGYQALVEIRSHPNPDKNFVYRDVFETRVELEVSEYLFIAPDHRGLGVHRLREGRRTLGLARSSLQCAPVLGGPTFTPKAGDESFFSDSPETFFEVEEPRGGAAR